MEYEKRKQMMLGASFAILLIYFIIVLYVLFGMVCIHTSKNCVSSIVFEGIGFFILILVVTSNMGRFRIKTGCYLPIIVVTVIYTLLLNVLNIIGTVSLEVTVFLFLHLILLFIYLMVVVPMYIIGKQ